MNHVEQYHRASQYLAMAGKSFLPIKEDDSQSNMIWESDLYSLVSHVFTSSFQLALNHKEFKLQWHGQQGEVEFELTLDGLGHSKIMDWLISTSQEFGLENPYTFELHYDLPYEQSIEEFVFTKPDEQSSNYWINLRNKADEALYEIKSKYNIVSNIRVWPHHFDSGLLLNENDYSFGLGMSIADSLSDVPYYYAAAYLDGKSVKTDNFPKLRIGEWMGDKWDGAILKSNSKENPVDFYSEAIESVLNL